MSTLTPAESARLRPVRAVVWAVYLTISTVVSLATTISVFKSTLEMSPSRPAAQRELSVSECASGASSLLENLEQQRQRFATDSDPSARFIAFRVDWLKLKRQFEADCDVDNPARKSVQTAFEELELLMDSYTTQAVQFGVEVSPRLLSARAAISSVK